MKRIIAITALLMLASLVPTRATVLVRELWDNITNGVTVSSGNTPNVYLQGQTNGTTSYGFFGAAYPWTVNPADPAATNALLINPNSDLEDYYVADSSGIALLPASWTAPGTLSLAEPNTNGWDSGTWATRWMALNSWIHLGVNGTNYFSFRWVKRSFFYPVSSTNGYGDDDAGLGVGFASGNSASSAFVGIGITRSMAIYTYTGTGYTNLTGTIDLGDTPYITAGTLGQAGYPGHPGDSGGPYYVRAYAGDGSGSGYVNQCEGYTGGYPYQDENNTYMWGGVLVGRIITSTSGTTQISIRNYSGWDSYSETIDTSPSAVNWDANYTFTTNSTIQLQYLLLWMYGNDHFNPCQIDDIRVATTWGEILGQEAEQPTVSPVSAFYPTNFYYGGTPLTLTEDANLDSATNGWYQWLYNGTAIGSPNSMGIGSNTYLLPNPDYTASGNYSVVFSNGWDGSGLLVTSPPIFLLITNPSAPIFVTPPQAGARYLAPGAASYSNSVYVIGSPPYSYQWYQITTNGVTNLLADQTNVTLLLNSPITASMAGSYFVRATNYLGASTSAPALFSVIVPTPGSYAAQVVSNSPWAYWRLDEDYGTTKLHDYYGGNDGAILDPTNVVITPTSTNTYGVYQDYAAAPFVGFPANHVGLFIPNNGQLARVNMPGPGLYTNVMTWMGWIYLPSMPNTAPFIWNRDNNSNSGYGNAFGLEFLAYVTGGITNENLLGYQWGGPAEDVSVGETNAYLGWTYSNSDMYVPLSNWTFVAWVVNGPSNATLYMGTNNGPLTVASATMPSAFDPEYPGTVYSNSYSLLLGRGGYPWAESPGNAWNNANAYMSDVAIFYSALPSNSIYKIYLAATHELITYTNSAGNLVLSWPSGTLMSSTNVQGPYTAVVGATAPYYTVPKTAPRQFYRIQ